MIYINNIKQISIQEPLSDAWFDDPLYPVTLYNEGKDPDFKQFLPIPIMRRLGRPLQRYLRGLKLRIWTESSVAQAWDVLKTLKNFSHL